MAIDTREIITKIKNKDKESFTGMTVLFIKVIGIVKKLMAKESFMSL
jgi:hypothetical protein